MGMTRTPDEIKKGLELCYEGIDCSECPYVDDCFGNDETPFGAVMPDALALIQQLQAQNAEKDRKIQQLEATVSEKEKVVAELSGKIGQLEADNKLLQDAVDQWEFVAASPGAVEDMARENAMLTKYARQREKQVTELSAGNVKLQKEILQLKAERDALMQDMNRSCFICKHFNSGVECLNTVCAECVRWCNWGWRGVQKEE